MKTGVGEELAGENLGQNLHLQMVMAALPFRCELARSHSLCTGLDFQVCLRLKAL